MGILISWNAFLNKYNVVVYYVLVKYKTINKKMSVDIIILSIIPTLNKLYRVYSRRRRYLQYTVLISVYLFLRVFDL